MNSLSSFTRSSLLQQASAEVADLLIIGGGITGAGIALDAAARGLKVVLIEKQDFAAGTSSRSTKLIHGGLRYLKQAELKLVHEVGSERAVIYKIAPHLVVPEKMLLPLIKGGSYSPLMTSFGLWLYDKLAGVKASEQRRMLSAEEIRSLEPMLRKDLLVGGGLYVEYRTDDARLTLEILKTAAKKGALPLNYVEAQSFTYEHNELTGLVAKDKLTGETLNLKARQIVSAAGPWVDTLRSLDNSLRDKRLHLTKGVHIVVPHGRLPVHQATYFDVQDGRMIFAIPRGKITYIGTTDTNYQGALEHPKVELADVTYLLKASNEMFPSAHLKLEDVLSSWAGLRPLIHEEGKSASELSRKDEIFTSPSGLISIAGGKLTGYRKMSERVVDKVAKKLKQKYGTKTQACSTAQIVISGGAFSKAEEVPTYIKQLATKLNALGLGEQEAEYLTRLYGTQAEEILEKMLKEFSGGSVEQALIRAELGFCMQQEAVYSLCDFFIRRTGRLYFDIASVDRYKMLVLEEMQKALGWNQAQAAADLSLLEEALRMARKFE